MTNDLFVTKEDQLLSFCQGKGYFSKADVIQWGLDNYYLRSDRTLRDFVRDGKIKKLSDDEKLFRGMKGKMSYYEAIK